MNDIINAMNKKIEDIKNKNQTIEEKRIVDTTYDSIEDKKKVYRPIYFVD